MQDGGSHAVYQNLQVLFNMSKGSKCRAYCMECNTSVLVKVLNTNLYNFFLQVLGIDIKTEQLVKYVREVTKKGNQADRLEQTLAQYCCMSGQSLI